MTNGVPPLSIGSVLGDSDRENMAWKKAISLLGLRVQVAREGLDSPLRVNVVYHVDGKLVPNEFEGVRTGRFSRKDSHLIVQAAVPGGTVDDRQEILWGLLEQAIDLAESYARAKKIADQLPEVREVVKKTAATP